jgi:hypothetical protein
MVLRQVKELESPELWVIIFGGVKLLKLSFDIEVAIRD